MRKRDSKTVGREADQTEFKPGSMAELRAAIDAALKRRGLNVEYDPYSNFFNHHKKTERLNDRQHH